MNKKGVSPLIVTVILIGFVFVMASFIFMWSSGLTKGEMEKQSFTFQILDFGVRASPGVSCDDDACINNRIDCDDDAEKCYCILIVNEESKNVNYLVTTTGNLSGTSVCDPVDIGLGAYESKVFGIVFNENIVGSGDLVSEIDAVYLD